MNAHDQDIYNRLSQLSGPEFDRAYAREMVNGHKQVIADFRSESDNGQDQAIKDFAFRTLPALQDHMKLARQMLHDVEPGNSKQNGNK
jgi:putative membrane protein